MDEEPSSPAQAAKDLFAGAVGGVAQVLIGEGSFALVLAFAFPVVDHVVIWVLRVSSGVGLSRNEMTAHPD